MLVNKELIKTFSSEIKILAKNAVQKPAKLKPLTSFATSIKTSALITNRNRPIVSTVSGKVNTINSGLTSALAKPNTKAEIIKDPVSVNLRPLKTKLAAHSDRAVTPQVIKNGVELANMVLSSFY